MGSERAFQSVIFNIMADNMELFNKFKKSSVKTLKFIANGDSSYPLVNHNLILKKPGL